MFLNILAWILFGVYVFSILLSLSLSLVFFIKEDRGKTVQLFMAGVFSISVIWAITHLYSQGLLW